MPLCAVLCRGYETVTKKLILAVALVALGCGTGPAETTAELAAETQELQGTSPNPLTFWYWAGDPDVLVPALECALARVRAATCLPVDVSLDAHHWVRQMTRAAMGGRAGWTTGSVWSTRIRIDVDARDAYACDLVTHEVAIHTLRRASDHIGPNWPMVLDAPYLESICSVQECGCFVPEPQPTP